jgi:hypothetical protein
MNAPWSPEVLLRPAEDGQAPLPLGADGVARWVWESRFGAMLIEVIDGAVFVNGDRVLPHAPALTSGSMSASAPASAPASPLSPPSLRPAAAAASATAPSNHPRSSP